MFSKRLVIAVPDDAINRTHRVKVRVKNRNTGEFKQAMIVKFLTWTDRNANFRSRKKSTGKHILLDLTAKRAKFLKFAKEKPKICEKIEFVFADINCRIGLKTTSRHFKFLK